MTQYTPNYNLDLYEDTDKPNLRDQYNSAMGKIDVAMSRIDDAASADITTDRIVDGAVTADKIANTTITASQLADGSVNGYKLALDSVYTNHIHDGAVTNAKMAANSVTNNCIVDGTINESKLSSVTPNKIRNLIGFRKFQSTISSPVTLQPGELQYFSNIQLPGLTQNEVCLCILSIYATNNQTPSAYLDTNGLTVVYENGVYTVSFNIKNNDTSSTGSVTFDGVCYEFYYADKRMFVGDISA